MKWLEELKQITERHSTMNADTPLDEVSVSENNFVGQWYQNVDRLIAIAEGCEDGINFTGSGNNCIICAGEIEIYTPIPGEPRGKWEQGEGHDKSCPYSDEWEAK